MLSCLTKPRCHTRLLSHVYFCKTIVVLLTSTVLFYHLSIAMIITLLLLFTFVPQILSSDIIDLQNCGSFPRLSEWVLLMIHWRVSYYPWTTFSWSSSASSSVYRNFRQSMQDNGKSNTICRIWLVNISEIGYLRYSPPIIVPPRTSPKWCRLSVSLVMLIQEANTGPAIMRSKWWKYPSGPEKGRTFPIIHNVKNV